MSMAFYYLEKNYAMAAKDYVAYNENVPERGDCKYDASKATTCMVKSYTTATAGDVTMIKMALSHQPVTATLNGSCKSYQTYASGVYDDEKCAGTQLNHAVTMVGYGAEQGEEYWIVKDSWGTNWGDAGYIKIAIKPGAGIAGVQSNVTWTVLV